jgi:hypothetical protein
MTYENYASESKLVSLANSFLDEMSSKYDLRLGKEFDKEKANCSWFTNEFNDWAKSKGLEPKVVYFPANEESHTTSYLDGQILDFTIKQFTKNSEDIFDITTPEDYEQYGYNTFEILDEVPDWFTIRKADMIMEGYNKPRKGMKSRWSVKYKKKINCSNPKGFSQKQFCKRKRKGGKYKS